MIELTNLPDMSCNSVKGSVHISPEGHNKPCCYFKNLGPHWKYWQMDSNISNIDSLDDVVNSYEWNNFVSPNPHCEYCIKEEATDIYSLRQYWNETISSDTTKLQYLELALDFTCNMMCRICGPRQSSKWNVSPVLKNMEEECEDSINYVKIKGSKEYTKNIKRILANSDLSELKKVTLVGGEPLYSKTLPWFINLLKKQEHWKDISLRIITNGSIVPSKDLFEGFKRVELDVSLDAFGDLATATRMKVPWETIDANIREMMKLYKVFIHTTVSNLNCNQIYPLIQYCHDLNISPYAHTFALLHEPRHLSLNLIPKEYRQKWKVPLYKEFHYIDDNGKSYDINLHLYKLNNMLEIDYHESPSDVQSFLRAVEILDTESELSFRDVNPEIMKIMEDLFKDYQSDNKI